MGEADTELFIIDLYKPLDVSKKQKNSMTYITFYHEIKHLLDSFIFRDRLYSYDLEELTAELYAYSFIIDREVMRKLISAMFDSFEDTEDKLFLYFPSKIDMEKLYELLQNMDNEQLRVYSFAIPYAFAFTSLMDLNKLDKKQAGHFLIELGNEIISLNSFFNGSVESFKKLLKED